VRTWDLTDTPFAAPLAPGPTHGSPSCGGRNVPLCRDPVPSGKSGDAGARSSPWLDHCVSAVCARSHALPSLFASTASTASAPLVQTESSMSAHLDSSRRRLRPPARPSAWSRRGRLGASLRRPAGGGPGLQKRGREMDPSGHPRPAPPPPPPSGAAPRRAAGRRVRRGTLRSTVRRIRETIAGARAGADRLRARQPRHASLEARSGSPQGHRRALRQDLGRPCRARPPCRRAAGPDGGELSSVGPPGRRRLRALRRHDVNPRRHPHRPGPAAPDRVCPPPSGRSRQRRPCPRSPTWRPLSTLSSPWDSGRSSALFVTSMAALRGRVHARRKPSNPRNSRSVLG